MNDYWNNNQNNFLSLYQSLNPNSKKSVKSEINALEKLYQKTYLQPVIIKKNNTKTNNNKKDKFDQYSFKCLTKSLKYKILKGTKEVSFKIELENNGYFPWPINETFLLIDETKSMIKSEKISLYPLNPNEKKFFDIQFKKLDGLKPGIYKTILSFYAKGKNFGKNITVNIEVYE